MGDRLLHHIPMKFDFSPVTGSAFYGRSAEIENARDLIETDQRLVVIGERRIGKTSFWMEMQHRHPSRQSALWLVVPPCDSLDTLKQARLEGLAAQLDRSLAGHPASVEELLALGHQKGFSEVFFVYEELDLLLRAKVEPRAALDEISRPVSLQLPLKTYMIVTGCLPLLEEGMLPRDSLFRNSVIELQPLSFEEMKAMLEDTYQDELFFAPGVLDIFWQFSGGHPFLAKMLGNEIVRRINSELAQLSLPAPVSILPHEVRLGIRSIIADVNFREYFTNLALLHLTEQEKSHLKSPESISQGDPTAERLCRKGYLSTTSEGYAPRVGALCWAQTGYPIDRPPEKPLGPIEVRGDFMVVSGEEIPCSEKERLFLGNLLGQPGKTVLYPDLAESIRGRADVESPVEETLRRLAVSLQRRMGDNPKDPRWLIEDPVGGYVLREK